MGVGTNYPISAIDGISLPDIVRNDVPKLLTDGVFQGLHTYASRVVTITMNVKGTSASNLQSNMESLEAAWAKATSDIYFVVRIGGTKRRISGRPIEFDRPTFTPSALPGLTVIGVRAQFEAGDPTWTTI